MTWLRLLRAQYLVARNRTEEAARLYREILRSKPVHVPGIFVVLSDCRSRGAVDAAIEFATRALAVDDEHFMALQTLGWAYVTQGNHASAQVVVARALEQFEKQRLGEPSKALRAADWVPRSSRSRQRFHVADNVADSLNAWKRWAQAYLGERD